MTEPYATRREFDQLAARVESMDDKGTRGVPGLAVQIADLIKDVSGLENKLDGHERSHRDEATARRSNVKWAVGLAVAILTSNGGVIALLITRH